MKAPTCSYINRDCTNSPTCGARKTGKPCWLSKTKECCRRSDSSRCIYCSIYLEYLGNDTGNYSRILATSQEPASFAEQSREFYEEHGHRISDPIVIEQSEAYFVGEDGSIVSPESDED